MPHNSDPSCHHLPLLNVPLLLISLCSSFYQPSPRLCLYPCSHPFYSSRHSTMLNFLFSSDFMGLLFPPSILKLHSIQYFSQHHLNPLKPVSSKNLVNNLKLIYNQSFNLSAYTDHYQFSSEDQ